MRAFAVLFHDAPHAQAAAEVAAQLAMHAPIDSLIDRPAALDARGCRSHRCRPRQAPLLLVYTSGSTGQPRRAAIRRLACWPAPASWWAHGTPQDDRDIVGAAAVPCWRPLHPDLPALLAGAQVTLHQRSRRSPGSLHWRRREPRWR
ncbi:hypothetical protein ACU4HD_15965 [Cupriavidus basilensis]